MPTRTLRRSVLLHDLSRVGFGGLRFAVVLLLVSAALGTSLLAWIGAVTNVLDSFGDQHGLTTDGP